MHCHHLLQHGMLRAPGLSLERCRAGATARTLLPQPSHLCGFPEWATKPTSPASFQSSQTDLCSATEMGESRSFLRVAQLILLSS